MPNPLNLESLVSAGLVNGVDVSPDGRRIVFASSEGGRSALYVQAITEPFHRERLNTGAQAATQPRWSPRGDLIAYLEDVGGDENYRICLIPAVGGEPRDLTQRPGKLHENHSWSTDGSKIAFVSNRDGQFDVYYSIIETGEVCRVTDHPSVHHSPEFSPDGHRISYSTNRTGLRSNWDTFVASLDGKEEMVTQHEGEADEMSYYAGQRPMWSPDGKSILVASSVKGNYDVMSIDVETKERTWIAQSEWDEGNGQWSPDGTRVAYVVNRGGNFVIQVCDFDAGSTREVSQPQGNSGSIGMRGKGPDFRWTPDGTSIVYGRSGPTESGSVWIADIADGTPRQLYSSMPAALRDAPLTSPTLEEYQSFDRLSISAFLYRPASSAGKSAIIMPHGGPTGQSTNSWQPLIQYVVSLGFAVLAPNFRGSTGYGREFQWLNRDDWGGADLRDVVEGANWLEGEGFTGGIGIMGGSYGGFMTLSAITQYPHRWAAAVSIFGIANLETMYRTAREDMRLFQERNIGRPEENPQFYRDRSPLTHVDKITCPLLILQGDRDPRVPLSEAQQMREALQRNGKQFEYVVYADEGHGFARLDSRVDYVKRIGDFFAKYLPS